MTPIHATSITVDSANGLKVIGAPHTLRKIGQRHPRWYRDDDGAEVATLVRGYVPGLQETLL